MRWKGKIELTNIEAETHEQALEKFKQQVFDDLPMLYAEICKMEQTHIK